MGWYDEICKGGVLKLYVLPSEVTCNAKCAFCVTKQRKYKNIFLKVEDLYKALKNTDFEKIEITGGGEPALNKDIDKIIKICCEKAPTQIYTNGTLDPNSISDNILFVCISRAHWLNKENEKIMGIKYDINKFSNFPLKLSLLLHKSGISKKIEVFKYLKWAKSRARKVVIRQLFEPEDEKYRKYYEKEFISSQNIFNDSQYEVISEDEFSKTYLIDGLEVEVEKRGCACECADQVLHADGKIGRW